MPGFKYSKRAPSLSLTAVTALYFNDVSLGASGLPNQPLVKKLTAIRVAAAGFGEHLS